MLELTIHCDKHKTEGTTVCYNDRVIIQRRKKMSNSVADLKFFRHILFEELLAHLEAPRCSLSLL